MDSKHRILITGGAGFIGSNLAEHFLKNENVELVRVVDDLSNGYYSNIAEFVGNPKFEFVEGDITDMEVCRQVMQGITEVTHQAALGSVPRSIDNPMRTNEVNVGGTVNILFAAKEANVNRVVLAFSSSTYGDDPSLPKVESVIGQPLSPYAVSKHSAEQYAAVFHKTYGLDYIGLRYFNIYGPKQNPDNPYAAVIPIFCRAFINGDSITINGDGETSRDFTFVENAIHANELALFTQDKGALNKVYNTACGKQTSLNELVRMLENISGNKIEIDRKPERLGDVKHSMADIQLITDNLDYKPKVQFSEGLLKTYQWLELFEKSQYSRAQL